MTRNEALSILGFSPGSYPKDSHLKSAWRNLTKRCHPDVNDDPKAEEEFKRTMQAYEILLSEADKNSHKEFDEFKSRFSKKKAHDLQKHNKLTHPNNRTILPESPLHLGQVKVPLPVFILKDAYEIEITVTYPCYCLSGDQWIQCKICDSVGYQVEYDHYLGTKLSKCKQCKGYGWLLKYNCGICKGKRKTVKSRVINVTIPDDYLFNSMIILKNTGNIGWNCDDGHLCFTPIPKKSNLASLTEEEVSVIRQLLLKLQRG